MRNGANEKSNHAIQQEDNSTPIITTTPKPNFPISATPYKRQSAKEKSPAAKLRMIPSTSKLNSYHEELQKKLNKVLKNKKYQPHLIGSDYEINLANAACKVPEFIMPQLNSIMDPVTGNLLECTQLIKGLDRNM